MVMCFRHNELGHCKDRRPTQRNLAKGRFQLFLVNVILPLLQPCMHGQYLLATGTSSKDILKVVLERSIKIHDGFTVCTILGFV